MNMIMIKRLNDYKPHFKMLATALVSTAVLLTTACSVDDGKIQNPIELPSAADSVLNFQCVNEGIFEETCVLDNPENPYANVAINDNPPDADGIPDPANKFTLNDSAPSAKARYYLWATALAKGVGLQGENQYYTALALHEVYTESGSPTTQQQAKNAYRSVLDNYFLSVTFFEQELEVDGEIINVPYANLLNALVAENLYAPVSPDLISLYEDPILALGDMSEWGYVYDITNKTVSQLE